jgi:hypothetical protein
MTLTKKRVENPRKNQIAAPGLKFPRGQCSNKVMLTLSQGLPQPFVFFHHWNVWNVSPAVPDTPWTVLYTEAAVEVGFKLAAI